jgi:hypothetical protein
MSPILNFDGARHVSVSVAGVSDELLTNRIASAVKCAFRHIVGKWIVGIEPGVDRGQWRMKLQGAAGVHIWSFAARGDTLPDVVEEKLAAFFWMSASEPRTRLPGS